MKKSLLLLLFAIPAVAQVAVTPYRNPRATFTTSTGQPLSGGCVYTYQGGTTTPQVTYTSAAGSTANANPVVLDATGSAVIWLGPNTYKFAVYSYGGTNCASGSLQYTVDQVTGSTWVAGTISGATITNPTITGGTIDNTNIGSTTPAPVAASYFSGPIGNSGGTPASGAFTSLSSALNALSFSATPVFNAANYGFFTMILTGNVTSSSITGGSNGQLITFDICENATGGYSFAWPANMLGAPAINQNANGCTIAQAFFNGTDWITTYSTSAVLSGIYNYMTFSSTPVFTAGTYSYFTMTLTGNVTSSTISGGVTGQIISIDICQNGTGGYTFAWPSNVTAPPAISLAVNACTAVPAVFNGTNWIAGFGSSTLAHAIVMADLANSTYGTSATVNIFNAPVSGTVPVGGAGTYNGVAAASKCTLMTAATASTTFALKDGTSTIGTIVFGISGMTGTINISTPFTVASGDAMTIVAPASADATAAGLNCSIVFAY